MAFHRVVRWRRAGFAWQALSTLDGDGGWSPAYEVESPRLLWPGAGAVQIALRGQQRWCDAGHAVWLTPGERYRFRTPRPGQPWRLLVQEAAAAGGAGIEPLAGRAIAVDAGPARWLPLAPTLQWRLLCAAARLVQAPPGDLEAEEGFAAGLAEVLEAANGAGGAAERPRHAAVERARAFLAATAHENRSLAEIAAAAACSPWQLARQFRRHTGTSLHGWRRQLRLAMALHELAEPSPAPARLVDLALAHGWASQSHFGAAFGRSFGCTPAQARARLRQRPVEA